MGYKKCLESLEWIPKLVKYIYRGESSLFKILPRVRMTMPGELPESKCHTMDEGIRIPAGLTSPTHCTSSAARVPKQTTCRYRRTNEVQGHEEWTNSSRFRQVLKLRGETNRRAIWRRKPYESQTVRCSCCVVVIEPRGVCELQALRGLCAK